MGGALFIFVLCVSIVTLLCIFCFLHCLFPCLCFVLLLQLRGCAVGSLTGAGRCCVMTGWWEGKPGFFPWTHALSLASDLPEHCRPVLRADRHGETLFARSVASGQLLGGLSRDVCFRWAESLHGSSDLGPASRPLLRLPGLHSC